MREIAERLHENRQIQLAKEILENAGYKVSKKEELEEGLFGIKSKADKQKEYIKIIKEVFDDDIHGIVSTIYDIAADIFSKIAVDASSERHTQVRSELAAVDTAINEIKSSPDRILSIIERIAMKNSVDLSYTDSLDELKKKFNELQKAGEKNLGYKAKEYLFEQIGEKIIPQLQQLVKSLKDDARYDK